MKCILVGFLALSAVMTLNASPACVTLTPNNNLIAGAPNVLTAPPDTTDTYAPCAAGPLVFENVSYNLNTGAFVSAPYIAMLSAAQTANAVNIALDPNLAPGSDAVLEFEIAGGGIEGIGLSYDGTGTGYIDETACKTFTYSTCTGSDLLGTIGVDAAYTSENLTFASPQSDVWIVKDIASGNLPFSEVDQSYVYSVPEPAAMGLAGLGLLGMGWFRRMRYRRR